MLTKANSVKIFLILALSVFPRLSYADYWSVGVSVGGRDRHDDRWGHHDRWGHDWDRDEHHFYRWHDHPHWGYHCRSLPFICDTIWVGYTRYYYCDGLYYSYVGYGDYVLVEPPVGAYVEQIPSDFHSVIINGGIYYTDNGIYYISTSRGYRVIPAPVVEYVQPAPVVYTQPVTTVVTTQVQQPAPVYTQDTFPINVPNNNGSYTLVVIHRSGNGFVGPKGEFYSTFPTVAQLKAMYAK